MSDIKLFQGDAGGLTALSPQTASVERALQRLLEDNLETVLGVRFLATEYSTGPVHGGRIDTLGLDEDYCPVIIEYKRSINENVINQGLFYLDWLMDHKKDFQWLTMEMLGPESAKRIDWSSPRLICIAGDFTRYDGHAVKQINRNIELIRYKRFDKELLLIELVHASRTNKASDASTPDTPPSVEGTNLTSPNSDPYASQRIANRLANASIELRDIFDQIANYATSLGDDVQTKELKYYFAFKRLKNFMCLEIYPQNKNIAMYLKINPEKITIEPGFTRDVRKIGHFGTGDLEVSIRNYDDFLKSQPLIQKAYEGE